MPELVSILIPAYNAEQWIGMTLASALEQTWPYTEIIVVDDGSCDGTYEAARRYASKRLKVVTQENRGAGAARNRALSLAQGDYIQWLDADDLLAPDKIARQLNHPGRMHGPRVLQSCAWGRFRYAPHQAVFEPNALWQDRGPRDWIAAKFEDNVWMLPAAWLIGRDLTDLAGPWDERLTLDDDGEYFCRVVAYSTLVQFIPDAVCYYRYGNFGSLSSQRSDRALDSLFLSIQLCIEHARSVADDIRMREACLRFLQHQLSYFYPDRTAHVETLRALARDLGGTLVPPSTGGAFRLIKSVFGWRTAKRAKALHWKYRTGIGRNWDRMRAAFHRT
jgi:glycosyltransferase involved in cell wall biosynthesis